MGKPAGEPSRDKITVEAGFKPACAWGSPVPLGPLPSQGHAGIPPETLLHTSILYHTYEPEIPARQQYEEHNLERRRKPDRSGSPTSG